MQIGQLAERSGLSRDTLRFYEKLGLIKAFRRENGYRDYPELALQVIHCVRCFQDLGFSLTDISEHFHDLWQHPEPEAHVTELLVRKALQLEDRIRDLRHLQQQLLDQAVRLQTREQEEEDTVDHLEKMQPRPLNSLLFGAPSLVAGATTL